MAGLQLEDLMDLHGVHAFVVGMVDTVRIEELKDNNGGSSTNYRVLKVTPFGADSVDFWVKADSEEGGHFAAMRRGQQVAVQATLSVRGNGTVKYKFKEFVSIDDMANLLLGKAEPKAAK